MPRLGAHMSVAGGVHLAVARAQAHGCEALQIFAKNANQWHGRELTRTEVRAFRAAVRTTGIGPVVSHASYLINLATTAPVLRAQSIAALIDEVDRADALGLMGVVLHPGTCTAGTELEALRAVGAALRDVLRARPRSRTRILLEHTAGQGRTVGHRFEHLAAILGFLDGSRRIAVCLDTCHLLASGYRIHQREGFEETIATFDRVVGLDRLRVVHLNDSKKPCGSRVDRHEHIGQGCLGLAPFRWLLNDPRLAGLPMLLETPKADGPRRPTAIEVDRFDARNLARLRQLIATR